jgi:hypothetical protein
MEINISKMRNYYETPSTNGTELLWKVMQNHSFESTWVKEGLKSIIRDCPIFGNEIWPTIRGLRNDPAGKENAHTEYANCINDDLCLLKARDDYWKYAVHSWAQGQERCNENLAEPMSEPIDEIQGHVGIRNTLTDQVRAQQFYEELKKNQTTKTTKHRSPQTTRCPNHQICPSRTRNNEST